MQRERGRPAGVPAFVNCEAGWRRACCCTILRILRIARFAMFADASPHTLHRSEDRQETRKKESDMQSCIGFTVLELLSKNESTMLRILYRCLVVPFYLRLVPIASAKHSIYNTTQYKISIVRDTGQDQSLLLG